MVLPEDPIWLDADPVRVLQVIENLLSNAVKYTNSGGSIEVSVSREDGFAAVRVRDDGIGIDGDLIAQIFEPFTQASSLLDRPRGGLGIGLTLVRQFTEMHGGTVAVSSEGRDRGSEFVVRLPLAPAPGKGAPRPRRRPGRLPPAAACWWSTTTPPPPACSRCCSSGSALNGSRSRPTASRP